MLFGALASLFRRTPKRIFQTTRRVSFALFPQNSRQNWRYGNYKNGLQPAFQTIDLRRDGHATIQGKTTMCLALYLAASQELPVIGWDETKPAFHVIRLPKSAEDVRKHFRSEYVYYAGSQQGCSCAFNYEHEYDSIVELRDYLRNALICVSEVEIFACQTGSEERETQHALITSPEGISLPEFCFKDGQYLVIRSVKETQPVTEAEKCLQRVTRPVPLSKSIRSRLIAAKRATLTPLCADLA
jgi:hypothetical protein